MRYTKKCNGKNVIPLLNAMCGIDMPYWRIDRADDLHSYLSGDAADKLAAYEDAEEKGLLLRLPFDMKGINLVVKERERQIDLWGDQSGNHLFEWISILGEEYGELCEAVNETCFRNQKHPERGGKDNIVKEAVHVAAVAVAIAEAAMDGVCFECAAQKRPPKEEP